MLVRPHALAWVKENCRSWRATSLKYVNKQNLRWLKISGLRYATGLDPSTGTILRRPGLMCLWKVSLTQFATPKRRRRASRSRIQNNKIQLSSKSRRSASSRKCSPKISQTKTSSEDHKRPSCPSKRLLKWRSDPSQSQHPHQQLRRWVSCKRGTCTGVQPPSHHIPTIAEKKAGKTAKKF